MSLYELGTEYLRQAAAVREKIRVLRESMQGMTRKQQYLCRCRILSLDDVAISLKITGEHLTGYYGGTHD